MSLLNESTKSSMVTSLDYRKIGKILKFYIYLRSGTAFDLVSTEYKPSRADELFIKEMISNGVISDTDVALCKFFNKPRFLIKDDTTLNAVRICQ